MNSEQSVCSGHSRSNDRSRPGVNLASALCVLFAASVLSARAWSEDLTSAGNGRVMTMAALLDEIRARNPEISAANQEREAAQQRIAPARALDEPMLELGVANLPIDSLSFRKEDMTMKMLGLSQRLPFPGKRELRAAVASKEADSVALGYEETVNRVLRDAKLMYFELALVRQSRDIVRRNRTVVEQFLRVAEARYAVGQSAQPDVLKAQTQLTRMSDELLRIDREEATVQADLRRMLDDTAGAPIVPVAHEASPRQFDLAVLRESAVKNRPQLRGLERLVDRYDQEVALMQREFYPDFDVSLTYGQRDPAPDGMRREDMVSLTVAVNLPIWRKGRLEPKVAEARAMRERTREMLRAQTAEVLALLDTQIAAREQASRSAALIDSGLLPQSRLAVESSLAAYRVGRVDFATLLDNQMIVFTNELEHSRVNAEQLKAVAEIEFLIGKAPE